MNAVLPRLDHKMVGLYHVFTSVDVPALYVADLDRDRAAMLVPHHIAELKAAAERRVERMRAKQVVGIAAE